LLVIVERLIFIDALKDPLKGNHGVMLEIPHKFHLLPTLSEVHRVTQKFKVFI